MDSGFADGGGLLLSTAASQQKIFLGILTPAMTEHNEEEEVVAMMVSQEHCHDGPCPYYPKVACGKVLCINDKFSLSMTTWFEGSSFVDG